MTLDYHGWMMTRNFWNSTFFWEENFKRFLIITEKLFEAGSINHNDRQTDRLMIQMDVFNVCRSCITSKLMDKMFTKCQIIWFPNS